LHITFALKDLPLEQYISNLLHGVQIRIKKEENAWVLTVNSIPKLNILVNLLNGLLRTPKIEQFHSLISSSMHLERGNPSTGSKEVLAIYTPPADSQPIVRLIVEKKNRMQRESEKKRKKCASARTPAGEKKARAKITYQLQK
jgi:sRNA-binding protein